VNIEKLNATITSSKVALSITILTFDYKVAFSFSIGGIKNYARNNQTFYFLSIKCCLSYNNHIGGTSMAKAKNDYFGLGRIVSLILAIIPFTSWVCGFATRFMEGKIVAGIIRLFLGFNIVWVLDLIFMITSGRICRFLNF